MYDLFYQKLLLYLKHHFKTSKHIRWFYNTWYDCYFSNFDFEGGVLDV